MNITELKIENYKGFKGTHTFLFDNRLNFFVGDNNTGKSSVFESIDFLRAGLPLGKTITDIRNKKSLGEVSVTLKLQGDIRSVINDFSQTKYIDFVFEDNEVETLLINRTTREYVVRQGSKDVEINVKKITLWNPHSSQFENVAGLDTVIKTLFETQFIWADTQPDDVSDFGTTKICGRLLSNAIGDFFSTPQWDKFSKIHSETFSTGEDSLAVRMRSLEESIKKIIVDQYGIANVRFDFLLPDPLSFIKAGGINLDDGNETSSKDKGTGMQRALALALIQVYADHLRTHPNDASKKKPLFLFIDEPETFLHPKAQTKLLKALDEISRSQQIFITTHSPYLLRTFDINKHSIYLCQKDADACNELISGSSLNLFGKSSPTWGEINYSAYGLPTVEYHNELYGFVQARATLIDSKNECIAEFDKFLVTQGSVLDMTWIHEKSTGDVTYDTTLHTYIRNFIHHPENTKNSIYTEQQLEDSIIKLINILKTLNPVP